MSTQLFDGPLPDHVVENLQRGVAPHREACGSEPR